MLSKYPIAPTIPVEDLARARQFYEDKLGLKPLDISTSGVLYKCGDGTNILIYKVEQANLGHIAAIFEVENLWKEVKALEKKGVIFGCAISDINAVDELTSLSAGHVACFQDSEGNVLGLVQMGMLMEVKADALQGYRT